ncbi:MAG: hypothetical protein NVS9B6_09240 [Candidatus Limnocylindrales bacterium]
MQELSSPPTGTTIPAPPATPAPSRSHAAGLGLVLAAAIVVGGSGGAAAGYVVSRAAAAPDARPAAPVTAAQPIRSASGTGVDGVVKVVEAVGPSVVTVVNYLPNGQPQSSGSGFVIDAARGYIVTNNHVVENVRDTRAGASFDVVTSDDRTLHAKLVGRDPQTDIAVLQVSDTHLVAATLADSGVVPVGALVVAIGSPLGTFQNTVTTGIVSGKGRQIPESRTVTLKDLVQTDAAINSGNSGGPLIWAATNEVVGMNTLVDRQNGAEGLGFAISSNTIRQVTAQLIARAG